jgi:hypothetical protein
VLAAQRQEEPLGFGQESGSLTRLLDHRAGVAQVDIERGERLDAPIGRLEI